MRVLKAVHRRLTDCAPLVRAGHYATWPVVTMAALMRVVLVVTGSYVWSYLVGVILLVPLAALTAHQGGICTVGRCGVLVVASPVEDAERGRRWLRLVHRPLRSPLLWTLITAWFVTTWVLAMPLASIPPVTGLVLVQVHAMAVHSRLRPWCPWCGGGGGTTVREREPAGAL